MRIKSSVFAYLLAGISLCIVIIGSTTAAAPDAGPAAKQKILSIPACEFNEIRWGDDWNTHREGGQLKTHPSGAFSPDVGQYYASVMLPNSAKILEIRLIGKNNDPPGITLNLKRDFTLLGRAFSSTIATVSISGLSSKYRTAKTTLNPSAMVNNSGSCYSLHLYLPDAESNDVIFHHAEIVYTGKW